MQSGISASTELRHAFTNLLSNSSQRGLLCSISRSPEALVAGATLASSGGSFSSDIAALQDLLKEDEAAYILLKDDAAPRKCIAVTYVPDHANVRQKMLFASTRLTLVRELGTEHFSSTLFATTKAELTPEGWAKHEAHGGLAAPLTEEEKNLVGIKEAEAQESMGTGARRGHYKPLSLPIDADATAALKRLQAGDEGLVQLEIDVSSETLKLAGTTPASSITPASLSQKISTSAPRYSFYAHRSASSTAPAILFIYTCPTNSKIKERMLYAASRNSVIHVTAPEIGVKIEKSIEASDPDEINEQTVLSEMEPEAAAQASSNGASRQGFARPKRPGRR